MSDLRLVVFFNSILVTSRRFEGDKICVQWNPGFPPSAGREPRTACLAGQCLTYELQGLLICFKQPHNLLVLSNQRLCKKKPRVT